MSQLIDKFNELVSRYRAGEKEYLEAVIRRQERLREEIRAMLPKLREENWQRLTERRQRLERERDELQERVKALQELRYRASELLLKARAAGDTSEIAKFSGEVAVHEQELAEVDKRLKKVEHELRSLPGESATWSGTVEELRAAMWSPTVFFDRDAVEALLAGAWQDMRADDQVFLRYSLRSGSLLEFAPPRAPRR